MKVAWLSILTNGTGIVIMQPKDASWEKGQALFGSQGDKRTTQLKVLGHREVNDPLV